MRVIIASPSDREKLVAELIHGDEQWAEVHQESGDLTLELYPRRDGGLWSFALDEVLAALETARQRLLEPEESKFSEFPSRADPNT